MNIGLFILWMDYWVNKRNHFSIKEFIRSLATGTLDLLWLFSKFGDNLINNIKRSPLSLPAPLSLLAYLSILLAISRTCKKGPFPSFGLVFRMKQHLTKLHYPLFHKKIIFFKWNFKDWYLDIDFNLEVCGVIVFLVEQELIFLKQTCLILCRTKFNIPLNSRFGNVY